MHIVMIGTGYVGLVSGACFADFGHDVTCVDKDAAKVDALLAGRIPIFEPGLDELVANNVAAGRLTFTLDIAEAVPRADAVFIAVGTPSRRGDGHADLCEKVGADVQDVAKGIGLDTRIGPRFLQPGPGYGGSCFPKDTLALLKTAQDSEASLRIVEAVVASNDNRKRSMGRKVIAALSGDAQGKVVALLGLTFKANTDDMRDSPAIAIVRALQDAGAEVRAYDPEGMEQARALLEDVAYCDDAYQAMDGADAAVIVTEWDAFRALDFERMGELLTERLLVDLRNLYDRTDIERLGFRYVAIGR
jgi:UDP-glucose 6-dehydrogenase